MTAVGTRLAAVTVPMLGVTAAIDYRVDAAEVARRRRAGCGAITDLAVLDALMGLPVRIPITTTDLTDRERRILRRAPAGALACTDERTTRLAVPPVSVELAVVRARDWRKGLARAGRFAPFCARAIHLPTRPADYDDAAMQAGFFGIGIFIGPRNNPHHIVEPAPHIRHRHTPAQWQFAEEVYQQIGLPAPDHISRKER